MESIWDAIAHWRSHKHKYKLESTIQREFTVIYVFKCSTCPRKYPIDIKKFWGW